MGKTKTLYMHTLDGQPALFCDWHSDPTEHYVAFAGKVVKARDLRPSLRVIRREQRHAMANCARVGGSQAEWASKSRYGYVRVEVPDVR